MKHSLLLCSAFHNVVMKNILITKYARLLDLNEVLRVRMQFLYVSSLSVLNEGAGNFQQRMKQTLVLRT